MPVLSRHHLANKFRQNWMAKYPTDNNGNNVDMCDVNLDDSLTSLSWLQNLNIMKITSPGAVQSDSARLNTHNIMHNYSQQMTINDSPTGLTSSSLEPVDYKNNPYVKPPYSYATLICMGMKETRSPKITLSAIYNWITDNFMYYRLADPSWQNSIRHNLSLNKCFQKVPRRKDEPGKGGFWSINPEYSDMLENGIFKKRRASRESSLGSPTSMCSPPPSMCSPILSGVSAPPPLKRIKSEPIDDGYSSSYSYCSPDDSNNRIVHFNCDEDEDKVTLSGDFSWTSILNQDIQVGGFKVKTEHLIDEAESAVEPLIEMSSPESATDDLGLEELLASANFGTEGVTWADDPLDLTVTGHTIRAPEWWSEDMNMSIDAGKENMGDTYNSSRNGLNTPVSSSPVHEVAQDLHPWADDRSYFDQLALAFDVDNIFEDFGNIPSPNMS